MDPLLISLAADLLDPPVRSHDGEGQVVEAFPPNAAHPGRDGRGSGDYGNRAQGGVLGY